MANPPAPPIRAALSVPGFDTFTPVERTGLWIASDGLEKRGKTHFAFQVPDPICVLSADTGTKAIANKFHAQGKRILWCPFSVDDSIRNQAEHTKRWEKVKRDFDSAVDSPKVKSIIVDTGSALWELIRLARFGKLTQVLPHHYTTVNGEFEDWLNGAYDRRPDLNVIITHKVKKEYRAGKKDPDKESWTGKYERAGYKDIKYLVDANIRHDYDFETKEFNITITESRYNMVGAVGQTLSGDMCNWDVLVEMLSE